ncbi:MAG: hypothetical protein HS117_02005 [Verrucomicrobiaceae bacterium]|jgi:hypothetical protein|nr:hypothetical protein [Verrucomicrobiaceae bacterium]
MSEEITASIKYDESYIREVMRLCPSKFPSRVLRLFIAAALGLFSWWGATNRHHADPLLLAFGYFGLLLAGYAFFIICLLWVRRRKKIEEIRGRNETWTFNEKGFQVVMPEATAQFAWDKITGWRIVDSAGILLELKLGQNWLPSRFFNDADDQQRLLDLLVKHAPSSPDQDEDDD